MTKPEIPANDRAQLLANGYASRDGGGIDHPPVIKLTIPKNEPHIPATWLLSELDPEDPTVAFGLCDLGMGFPELGSVSLTELFGFVETHMVPLKIESVTTTTPLGVFAEKARFAGRVVMV